jgi:hypothetical protein
VFWRFTLANFIIAISLHCGNSSFLLSRLCLAVDIGHCIAFLRGGLWRDVFVTIAISELHINAVVIKFALEVISGARAASHCHDDCVDVSA